VFVLFTGIRLFTGFRIYGYSRVVRSPKFKYYLTQDTTLRFPGFYPPIFNFLMKCTTDSGLAFTFIEHACSLNTLFMCSVKPVERSRLKLQSMMHFTWQLLGICLQNEENRQPTVIALDSNYLHEVAFRNLNHN
jgi:hypothetical protein